MAQFRPQYAHPLSGSGSIPQLSPLMDLANTQGDPRNLQMILSQLLGGISKPAPTYPSEMPMDLDINTPEGVNQLMSTIGSELQAQGGVGQGASVEATLSEMLSDPETADSLKSLIAQIQGQGQGSFLSQHGPSMLSGALSGYLNRDQGTPDSYRMMGPYHYIKQKGRKGDDTTDLLLKMLLGGTKGYMGSAARLDNLELKRDKLTGDQEYRQAVLEQQATDRKATLDFRKTTQDNTKDYRKQQQSNSDRDFLLNWLKSTKPKELSGKMAQYAKAKEEGFAGGIMDFLSKGKDKDDKITQSQTENLKERKIASYLSSFGAPRNALGNIMMLNKEKRLPRIKGWLHARDIEVNKKGSLLDRSDLDRIEQSIMTEIGISDQMQSQIRSVRQMGGSTKDILTLIAEALKLENTIK